VSFDDITGYSLAFVRPQGLRAVFYSRTAYKVVASLRLLSRRRRRSFGIDSGVGVLAIEALSRQPAYRWRLAGSRPVRCFPGAVGLFYITRS
jgi:hypothetical protein